MTAGPRNWASRLFLWLALAAVLVPALGSTGSPLRPSEGSAFSAFTSNVSLGPARASAPEKDRKEQRAPGHGGSGIVQPASVQAAAPAPGERFAARLARAHDPLPARLAAGPLGARAPPSSRTL